ncbi:DUF1275 domain-containing protein [Streptomyces sp. NBC_01498]|uniref:YoaK family protein n=1 Tax=Streptomyces sp. NBC_01498 TaxID=2975870 RepID=UPI002E7B7DC0|nr:YoaK family protein [Streptomyces sp. NBC_01498]WTL23291.1 DUF1275 domain-containing protein [Streptomyces sp. NBC_01498]
MSATEPVRPGRAQWAALILFAGASGAVDVLAFTALGQVFAGVMTGNLVLLGLSLTGTGDEGGPAAPLLALAGYVVGVAAVAPFVRRRPEEPETRWPRAVVRRLAAEVVLLAAVAVGWGLAGGSPERPWRDVVLVAVAAAMGTQSAALAAAGAAGGPGTYFTGTLTRLVAGVAGPRGVRRGDLGALARLIALAAGAAGAALAHAASAPWAMVVPLLWASAALACVAVRPGRLGPKGGRGPRWGGRGFRWGGRGRVPPG